MTVREPMLSLTNLQVQYGRLIAVRDISLEVNSGEIVSVVGPNGAGKSTTLFTISGVLSPTRGDIRFGGRSIVGLTPDRIVRLGISLVPEGRQIFAGLSVGENLTLGATVRTDRRGIETDLAATLGRFPILKQYLHAPAGRLSGGEQQQLAIARALLSRPKLLLLDEPSLGLAPLVIDRVFEALDGLRKDGVTILLIEQNATRALQAADRTYVMRSGRIALAGSRSDLRQLTKVEAAYFGV